MNADYRTVCFAFMFQRARGVWRPACVSQLCVGASITAPERRA